MNIFGKHYKKWTTLSPEYRVLQTIINSLNWHEKGYEVKINGKNLTNLRFVDGIILCTTNKNGIQQLINDQYYLSKPVGSAMNSTKKNNYVKLHGRNSTRPKANGDGVFKGQTVGLDKEFSININNAWKKY